MVWTEELIESMKLGFKGGLSGTQIAKELNEAYGTHFSRNAVIGKLHRAGLKRAEGFVYDRPKAVRKKYEGPKRAYKKRAVKWTPEIGVAPVKPPDTNTEIAMTQADEDIPIKQRKTLMQLTERTCKWPVGDPGTLEFFFCGGEVWPGQVYCGPHCIRAYQLGTGGRARMAA